MQPTKTTRGFTLVELMIVISIIGLLAAVALPNFQNYQSRSRSSEVKSSLAGISRSEISYYAESGVYVGEDLPCPALGAAYPSSAKQAWNSARGTFCDVQSSFDLTGWAPDGPVYYDYAVATESNSIVPVAGTSDAFFIAYALGDVDNDGRLSVYAYVGAAEDGSYDMSVCGFCDSDPPLDVSGKPILNSVAQYPAGQGSGFDDF